MHLGVGMRHIGGLLLVGLLGCDDGGGSATDPDAGRDALIDAQPTLDAALDAAADATPDATPDAGPACPVGEPVAHPVGAWQVQVDPVAGSWAIVPPHAGAPVLRSPPACTAGALDPVLALTAGEPVVNAAFGGFRFDFRSLDENLATGGVRVESSDGGVVVHHDLADGTSAAVRFEPFPGGGLRIALDTEAPGSGGWLDFECRAGEAFFGLGSQVIGPDLRGHAFPLWTQEQGISKPPNGQPFPVANIPEAAYAPLGVWHSSLGFSAVIGHDGFSAIDLCARRADRWRLSSHRALPALVLVPGDTPKARMAGVTAVVGRPSLPPAWAFAPWNDAVGGPARLRAVADRLRAEGVPSSAIWSEDWIGGEQSNAGYRLSYAWEWDPATYPDLPSDIQWLHDRGFAFLAYFNPFVPQPTRMWQEGVEGGWLVKDAGGAPLSFMDPAFRLAGLVDLTDEAARAWFAGYARRAAGELGIDGWMADFAEWLPLTAQMADGRDGWAAHNAYPLAWQQLNREVMEAVHADDPRGTNDWIYFARSGWASVNGGTPGVAPAMWAGDQNTDWDRDDGLPTALTIGVNLGLAGVAHYGSDIAGYTSVLNPHTTKELFYRWASLGALHPLMRTHHGSDECGNWTFDRDPESLAHFRRWARIHTRLLPYFQALALEAHTTGVPPVRHPWLVAPEDEALWRTPDQFFLGDALLVAPVVEQGATGRMVHLPADGAWPLLGTTPLPGGAQAIAAAPTELPVFVRPGTVLVLLDRVPDSFYGATTPGITDLADVAGHYRLALYPSENGQLQPTLVDEAVVSGAGFTQRPDWTTAQFAGVALPPCGEAPCQSETGVVVVGPGELAVGSARLQVPEGQFTVRWAGEAWAEEAEPTALTEIDPTVPPPCEP